MINIHLLTFIFIVLKFYDMIDWAWFWVLFPSIALISLNLLVIGGLIFAAIVNRQRDQ